MPSLNTGNAILSNPIKVDSSYNVGIGGAASGSFKLQVTGTTNITGALSGTSGTFSGAFTLATTSGVLAVNTTGRPAGVGGGDNGKIWSKQATTGNYGIATIASATDSFTYIGHNGTDALLGTSYGTTGAYTDLVIQTADVTRFRLSGSTGAATFTNSFTTSGTSVLFLSPSLGTNNTTFLQIGKNVSTIYNSGEISFKYVGDGSDTNMVSLGFYGSGQKLNVLGNGNVGININNPQTFLHVFGSNTSARGQLSIQSNNTSNAAKATWYYDTFNSGEIGTTGADFYALATNNFLFYSGGSPRMTISSGGNIAINTTSTSSIDQKLVINQGATGVNQGIPATTGSTQNGILRLRPAVGVFGETLDFGMNVGPTYGWIQSTNASGLNTNYNLALNPNGGSIGLGVISKTFVTGWAAAQVGSFCLMGPNPSSDPNAILGANVYRATDSTWRRVVTGYGNLIEFNQGNGDIRTYTGGTNSADTTISFVSGPFISNGGVSWTNGSSDIRKKKNFEPSQGLAELLQIEAVKYHFNWDEDDTKKRLGFKAQNLQTLIPEMVLETGEIAEDGSSYLTITPDYILPVLVKAIQELNQTVQNQQQQINSLINR